MHKDPEVEKYACDMSFYDKLAELFNAGSMIVVAGVHYHWLKKDPTNPVMIAAIAHAPFSICYHSSFLLTKNQKIINTLRYLDLTFIHATGSMMALRTSRDPRWFLVNVIYNSSCIIMNLFPSHRTRQSLIKKFFGCSILYTLPLVWRNKKYRYILAWAAIIFGGIFYKLGGFAHILVRPLALYLHYLLKK